MLHMPLNYHFIQLIPCHVAVKSDAAAVQLCHEKVTVSQSRVLSVSLRKVTVIPVFSTWRRLKWAVGLINS